MGAEPELRPGAHDLGHESDGRSATTRSQAAVDATVPVRHGRVCVPQPAVPIPTYTDADNCAACRPISPPVGRFRLNRDGTVFTGLADARQPRSRRVPVQRSGLQPSDEPGKRRPRRLVPGLPCSSCNRTAASRRTSCINWVSSPLERLSAFANGHFDVSDNVRVTGQAMVTRSKTESSLGLTSANINQWGAGVPFGMRSTAGSYESLLRHPGLAGRQQRQRHRGRRRRDAPRLHARRPIRRELRCAAARLALALTALPAARDSRHGPSTPEICTSDADPAGLRTRSLAEPRAGLDARRARRRRSTKNTTTTMSFTLGSRAKCRAATIAGTSRSRRGAPTTWSISSARCADTYRRIWVPELRA